MKFGPGLISASITGTVFMTENKEKDQQLQFKPNTLCILSQYILEIFWTCSHFYPKPNCPLETLLSQQEMKTCLPALADISYKTKLTTQVFSISSWNQAGPPHQVTKQISDQCELSEPRLESLPNFWKSKDTFSAKLTSKSDVNTLQLRPATLRRQNKMFFLINAEQQTWGIHFLS